MPLNFKKLNLNKIPRLSRAPCRYRVIVKQSKKHYLNILFFNFSIFARPYSWWTGHEQLHPEPGGLAPHLPLGAVLMPGRSLGRNEAGHTGSYWQVRGGQRHKPRRPRHGPGHHGRDHLGRWRHPPPRPWDAGSSGRAEYFADNSNKFAYILDP